MLYFYPKNNTYRDTTKAKYFTNYALLNHQEKNIDVSSGSEISHLKFLKKHDLSIEMPGYFWKESLKLTEFVG